MQRIILKISGEALANKETSGICASKVKEIALEIKDLFETGISLGIVVGAGNIWRGRDAKENGMERASADYMGMLATILNALALQNALEALGLETRVMTSISAPSVAEPYIRRRALNHLDNRCIVIFAGGTGSPFFTTDTAAVLRAAEVGADLVLMAKNGTDGVYDCDPNMNKNAKRFSKLTYEELISQHLIIMDLTAATLCQENNIKIIVFDMNVPGNIKKAIDHPEIGTVITN